MSEPTDDEIRNEEELAAQKKKKKGEGDSGQMGSGGSAYEAVVTEEDAARKTAKIAPLSVEKKKQVWDALRHYDIHEIMAAVVEFFSEWPMRASAHAKVDWGGRGANTRPFTMMHRVIDVGAKAVRDMIRARDRTRGADVKGLRFRRSTRPRVNPSTSDPNSGPVGAR